MDKKSVVILLGLAFAFIATGCSQSKDTSAQSQSGTTAANSPSTEYVPPDAKGIQTMTLRPTSIPDYLDLPAHIEPDSDERRARVCSRRRPNTGD